MGFRWKSKGNYYLLQIIKKVGRGNFPAPEWESLPSIYSEILLNLSDAPSL
jgi:hypothetical protein